jgi:hypothetical protein
VPERLPLRKLYKRVLQRQVLESCVGAHLKHSVCANDDLYFKYVNFLFDYPTGRLNAFCKEFSQDATLRAEMEQRAKLRSLCEKDGQVVQMP